MKVPDVLSLSRREQCGAVLFAVAPILIANNFCRVLAM